jgi:opacity protein-like surface antigen
MKIRFSLALGILVLLPVATAAPAMAQNRAQSWEFGPYLVFTDFDPDTEIQDETGLGFRFGYNFTPVHELEMLFDTVSSQDSVISEIDIDEWKFETNYVANFIFSHNQPVVPYFTTGLGFVRYEINDPLFGSDDETDPAFNIGGGVRFFFGKTFNLRLDFRSIFYQGDNVILRDIDFQNNEFSVGVGWVVGGHTGRGGHRYP